MKNWCSWCFKKTKHEKVISNWIIERATYKCTNCEQLTVSCRWCDNMAKVGERWHDECCAIHDGTINRFEPPNEKLKEIENWRDIDEPVGTNILGLGKKAVIKTALIGLSGGTLHELSDLIENIDFPELIGDDILSDEYADMATMPIGMVPYAGAAYMGNEAGQALFNSYSKNVKNFDLIKKKDGQGTNIIYVNGFLTEGSDNYSKWTNTIERNFKKHSCYELTWESKSLETLKELFVKNASKSKLKRVLGAKGKVKFLKMGRVLIVADIVGNPWSSAKYKSRITGQMLAYILLRSDRRKNFTLMGHSLGANVIYHTLKTLEEHQRLNKTNLNLIKDVHLLGGAVENNPDNWQSVPDVVKGSLNNYYSSNDSILRRAYKATSLGKDPIGLKAIPKKIKKIRNINVSKYASGHDKYFEDFQNYIN